jgi:biofilm PGA synthesis N-glycosyltransferase PgaC
MALPVIIFILILYGYALVIFLFSFEIDRDETTGEEDLPEHMQRVSVIIPFRNEENHMEGIIMDLASQSYPDESWEVVFVDDHSEDASFTKVASLIEINHLAGRDFYLHSLTSGKSGKKAALAHGIGHAKYDWIIQVDADCRLGPGFIASHMSFLERHPSDLVAGLVTTGKGRTGFLGSFERLEMLSLTGSAAGSFGLGRPMMCSGANLAYSRELYNETRTFDPEHVIFSGDDMFLMIGARKLGKILSFSMNRRSMVETMPVKDFRKLIIQRIRWGSKTTSYRMTDIQSLAILVTLTNIIILFLPLWIVLMAGSWPWLAGGWILKTFADFMLLWRTAGATGNRADLRWFLPVSLSYYPLFMITLAGILLRKPAWKR